EGLCGDTCNTCTFREYNPNAAGCWGCAGSASCGGAFGDCSCCYPTVTRADCTHCGWHANTCSVADCGRCGGDNYTRDPAAQLVSGSVPGAGGGGPTTWSEYFVFGKGGVGA